MFSELKNDEPAMGVDGTYRWTSQRRLVDYHVPDHVKNPYRAVRDAVLQGNIRARYKGPDLRPRLARAAGQVCRRRGGPAVDATGWR